MSSPSTTKIEYKWLGNTAYTKTTKNPKDTQEKDVSEDQRKWIKASSACQKFFGCKSS